MANSGDSSRGRDRIAAAPSRANEPWAHLVDLDRLGRWMDARGLGAGPIEAPQRLSGGTQNVLLRFIRDGREYVLRRPPENPYVDGSETMRREARVLRAMASSETPHPRLIADEPDADVLGAAFYLMEPIEGFCPPQGLPSPHADDPALRHAMGISVVDALAALRSVDCRQAGLEGFGRPDGFLERQAPRWIRQLQSYENYAGWDGRADIPGIEKVADWLTAHLPAVYHPGIIHGDFHLGNLLFERSGPRVAAIVDWELATLGDPLIDLGCLLATWADPHGAHPGCIDVTPWAGFPSEAELVAYYAETTGVSMADINWYVVLACFKLGIIQEGTYARAAAGLAERATADWMHATTINLFERALSRI